MARDAQMVDANAEARPQPEDAARTAATPADQAPTTAPPAPTATAGGPPAEIRIEPPPPNAVRVVPVPAGALVVLDAPFFHPDVARYVVDGEDLVVVLQNGAIVRLDGFFGHPEMPPSLSVVGGPAQTANDLLAQAQEAGQVEPGAGPDAAPTPEHGGGAGFAGFEPGTIGTGFAKAGALAGEAGAGGEGLGGGVEPGMEGGIPPELSVTGDSEATLAFLGLGYRPPAAGPTPRLVPGTPPWPATAIGDGAQHPVMDADRPVTVVFRSESSAMHNTFGVYLVAPDGTVEEARVLFPDVNGSRFDPAAPWLWDGRGPLVEGVSQVDLGTIPAGYELGFFLIADGARLNPELAGWAGVGHFELRDARTGLALDPSDPLAVPQLVHIAPTGAEHVVNTGNRLFVSHDPTPDTPLENPLNPDGAAHALFGFDPLRGTVVVGFEDVDKDGTIGGGLFHFDGDYDDVVVDVRVGPMEGRVVYYGTEVRGLFDVNVSDVDSTELSAARVALGDDARPGDFLTLMGVTDADGDGVIDGTNIAYSFPTPGELVLSGRDSLANYTTVLEAVRLGVDPMSGSAGNRTVVFQVWDADGLPSDPASATVRIENRLVQGGDGDDFLVGPDAFAALFGGAGNDTLWAGNGDDLLYGGRGNDRLRGHGGDDILIGGPGNDSLIGGAGADRYVVTGLADGFDSVRGFDPAEGDRIDLSLLFAGTAFPGVGAPGADDWLRTRPTDWDGDGPDDLRIEVDLDGPGDAYVFMPVLTLLNTASVPDSAFATDTTATVV